jgi:hypothetical protein
VTSFEEWFNFTSKAQEDLAGSETPVLTRSEVGIKLRPVGDYIKMLHRKPRPTPKPTPKVSKNETSADNSTVEEGDDEEEEMEEGGRPVDGEEKAKEDEAAGEAAGESKDGDAGNSEGEL